MTYEVKNEQKTECVKKKHVVCCWHKDSPRIHWHTHRPSKTLVIYWKNVAENNPYFTNAVQTVEHGSVAFRFPYVRLVQIYICRKCEHNFQRFDTSLFFRHTEYSCCYSVVSSLVTFYFVYWIWTRILFYPTDIVNVLDNINQ